jgi:hypothetical protein
MSHFGLTGKALQDCRADLEGDGWLVAANAHALGTEQGALLKPSRNGAVNGMTLDGLLEGIDLANQGLCSRGVNVLPRDVAKLITVQSVAMRAVITFPESLTLKSVNDTNENELAIGGFYDNMLRQYPDQKTGNTPQQQRLNARNRFASGIALAVTLESLNELVGNKSNAALAGMVEAFRPHPYSN